MAEPAEGKDRVRPAGTAGEVFLAFLKLGLTSFGGPIAHLGYFRDELVVRRNWLDEKAYADLVALCQFLPGPASSQTGFALRLMRAGLLGALAAFVAFTLPSAVLMVAFAYGAAAFGGPVGGGIVAGLKIVAHAVWGMARSLTPDRTRATIALVAVLIVVMAAGAAGQVLAIVAGGLAGLLLCRGAVEPGAVPLAFAVSRRASVSSLALFVLLLAGLPLAASAMPVLALFDAFYRAGSLVFGGGHVVLPLLESEVVGRGWAGHDAFLAGYGAAQAVPGPLFTFAAYLGAIASAGPGGIAGAAVALAAIFLPGFLLVVGVLPFWDRFRRMTGVQGLMRGANASVVGILGAALYDPVFTTAVTDPRRFALALACFVLLTAWKAPPWIVVLVGAAGGVLIGVP